MEVKKGATFLLGLEVEVDGEPQDLTGWEVTAAIGAQNRSFVQSLTVTVTDAPAGVIELSASTSAWPLGQLFFDIRYVTDSGQVILTDVVEVVVIQSITK